MPDALITSILWHDSHDGSPAQVVTFTLSNRDLVTNVTSLRGTFEAFFFPSRRRHTRSLCDWSSDVCSSDLFCWGSWANTQKLAKKGWRFELFYWDYTIGVLLLTLALGLTLGSNGAGGRGFIADLQQASHASIQSALIGGAIFSLANFLVVAWIGISGRSVAFPVGIGVALVLGVFVNYLEHPEGNAMLLFGGVLLVVLAIIRVAVADPKLPVGL